MKIKHRKTREGIPRVIHGESELPRDASFPGEEALESIKGSPAQGSSFDHLDFSSPPFTAQQGKLDFATCLYFGTLFPQASPGFSGLSSLGLDAAEDLGSQIGFGTRDWF